MNRIDLVRNLFRTDVDQRIRTRLWQILHRPGRVSVGRIMLEWLCPPQQIIGPEIETITTEWGWVPSYSDGPVVETVTLELSNGSGTLVPEVDNAALEWSDPTTAGDLVPEVLTTELGWAAGIRPPTDFVEVDSAGAEWSDGSALEVPDVDQLSASWGANIGDLADVEVSQMTAEWSDGTITDVPEMHTVRVEWARAGADPVTGEKYLIIATVDSTRLCTGVRVQAIGISEAQSRQCRVLVRADREDLDKTLWASYDAGELDADIPLQRPGRAVRVVIIGPAALPDDTDFLVDFERS